MPEGRASGVPRGRPQSCPPGTAHRTLRFPPVTALYSPAGAAEFPNDNPELHRGVRWVCPNTSGPARALLQAPAPALAATSPGAKVPAATAGQLPSPFRPAPADPPPPPVPPARRWEGPLELDLDRIVLAHRVEDVPPPPDFIFRPFVSSRCRPALTPLPALPIDPKPCRVIDGREACRRVERGVRVDIAPCLIVGAVGEPSRRLRRRRRRRPASRPPPVEVAVSVELEAASA
jgi:hypothetical protein